MVFHLLPLLLAMGGEAPPQAPPQTPPAVVTTRPPQAPRKLFNETTDAKTLIATAVAAAAGDDIRVLIVWGSNDDERSVNWPKVQRDPAVSGPRFFSDEYKVVYVDVGRADKNLDVATGYGMTLAVTALPSFTVLDMAGRPIGRASAADFSAADPASLDPRKVSAFLAAHQAPAPDAEPPVKAALSLARKDGKYVFLWFSAPW
jgi:hypothetical protein